MVETTNQLLNFGNPCEPRSMSWTGGLEPCSKRRNLWMCQSRGRFTPPSEAPNLMMRARLDGFVQTWYYVDIPILGPADVSKDCKLLGEIMVFSRASPRPIIMVPLFVPFCSFLGTSLLAPFLVHVLFWMRTSLSRASPGFSPSSVGIHSIHRWQITSRGVPCTPRWRWKWRTWASLPVNWTPTWIPMKLGEV